MGCEEAHRAPQGAKSSSGLTLRYAAARLLRVSGHKQTAHPE
jgi:hypothetical protein